MEREKPKPSPDMAAHVRRLHLAREVALAVEQRTRAHRGSATDKPADVLARLQANQNVRAAVAKLTGVSHE